VKVVVDTNALETDRYAKRPVADSAWKGAAAGDFELVVPEAVIEELVKHFAPTLQEAVADLDTALNKGRRSFDTFGLGVPQMPTIDVDGLCGAYEQELRARCSEGGCSIAPTPDLDPALEWSIARRKPFDANGHGLPDAAIWLTVLELAAVEDVVLVTNNSKDFGKPGLLHKELAEDLAARGIAEGRVRIVPDLHALRREIVEPAEGATARVHRLLADGTTGAGLGLLLVDALRQSTVAISDAELGFHLDEPPSLADLEPDAFNVVDAHELEDGQMLTRLEVRGDALLEVIVYRGDYFEAELEGVALEAFDPDRYVFQGELWVSGDMTIDAVVTLEGAVEEATIEEFDRLPHAEELQRRLRGEVGKRLIEELEREAHLLPGVTGYRPPETIVSSIEEATIEEWRIDGEPRVDEVLDRDQDGTTVSISVDATATVTWVVSAPDPGDLERAFSLAEGVEHGGGYLQDTVSDEPVIADVQATLGPDGWGNVEVDEIRLDPRVAGERGSRALAAEGFEAPLGDAEEVERDR
jgi:hypothetical protein